MYFIECLHCFELLPQSYNNQDYFANYWRPINSSKFISKCYYMLTGGGKMPIPSMFLDIWNGKTQNYFFSIKTIFLNYKLGIVLYLMVRFLLSVREEVSLKRVLLRAALVLDTLGLVISSIFACSLLPTPMIVKIQTRILWGVLLYRHRSRYSSE